MASSIYVPRGCARGIEPSQGKSPVAAGTITGTSGIWVEVTPPGFNLDATAFGLDNAGCNDVLNHPVNRNKFYLFTAYQGLFMSTDFGLTWTNVSPTGVMAGGKSWGSAIAPDGSYMLATSGNNFTQYGGVDGRRQVFKSTDDGVTWTQKGDMGADPYNVAIDPADKTHCICAFHDTATISESWDSGETWATRGAYGGGISAYARFISTTVLIVASQEGGSEGVWRGVSSGTPPSNSYAWTRITDLNGNEHQHGAWEPLIDTVNSIIFAPGTLGIYKSTNAGVNFTQVSSTIAGVMATTPSLLYASHNFPTDTVPPQSPVDPHWRHATAPAGSSWTNDATQSMTNGPKRMAVGTDGSRYCIVSGNWLAGAWRYVE